jgi:branched-subunit amino acid permease
MGINARVISDLDPGAIPGGSTNIFPGIAGKHGADQFRQACKGVCFSSVGLPLSGLFLDANDNFASEVALAA